MKKEHEHYYTGRPSSQSRPVCFGYEARGLRLRFETDSGVFSRSRVDFGSDLLINALPPLEGRVLDLGCGWGAVGIAAARLNPGARVAFADVNSRALELAERNAGQNGVIPQGLPPGMGFDAVLLNPPVRAGKKKVFELYGESLGRLNPGGGLYVVIQKKQGLDSSLAQLSRLFGGCAQITRKAGYHVLCCQLTGGAPRANQPPNIDSSMPAATAEPITPATLGPMANMSR